MENFSKFEKLAPIFQVFRHWGLPAGTLYKVKDTVLSSCAPGLSVWPCSVWAGIWSHQSCHAAANETVYIGYHL